MGGYVTRVSALAEVVAWRAAMSNDLRPAPAPTSARTSSPGSGLATGLLAGGWRLGQAVTLGRSTHIGCGSLRTTLPMASNH